MKIYLLGKVKGSFFYFIEFKKGNQFVFYFREWTS